MDLRQLRYFAAIAERSNFRAAADHLHLAQPALSQQIHRLEAELGVELFDRSFRPIRVTDAGKHLLPKARSILVDVERAAAEVRDFATQSRGRLAVGVMQYLTQLELTSVLPDFTRRYPLVELSVRFGTINQLCDDVAAGDLDIVICHVDALGRRPDLTVEPLREEELVIIVSSDDARAAHGSITIESLAGTPLIAFRHGASIREALMVAFDRAGLTPHVAFDSPDMPTAVGFVAQGLGVAMVPGPIAARETSVVALRIAPEPLTRQVALVSASDRHRSRAMEAFRTMTQAAMGSV